MPLSADAATGQPRLDAAGFSAATTPSATPLIASCYSQNAIFAAAISIYYTPRYAGRCAPPPFSPAAAFAGATFSHIS